MPLPLFSYRPRFARCGLATALVVIAAGLRLWSLQGLELRIPYVTFSPAVMLSALYGGPVCRPADDIAVARSRRQSAVSSEGRGPQQGVCCGGGPGAPPAADLHPRLDANSAILDGFLLPT
jgi:hypothetical protein